jgi:A/G-specific adenine glycosylase
MSSAKRKFTANLMDWHYHANERSLPWKNEKDPYKIWLSEIILQQTRAAQGLSYYLAFTEAYPDICTLAQAQDEDVFRLWQGLGYYNRCKNMLHTARMICSEQQGIFPNQYESILALKGVGAYTAAAIASFAFGLPHAVVDGNVYRVLSRYFGIELAIDSNEGKAYFTSLAQELLLPDAAADYNQAIMDLGATVCTPKQAQCAICPLHKNCVAYKENTIALLPIKQKKLVVTNRYFNFIVFMNDDKVWIQKRTTQDIWQNLHQFYCIESSESITAATLVGLAPCKVLGVKANQLKELSVLKQRLTHQLIESKFYLFPLSKKTIQLPEDGFWVSITALKELAFPKSLVDFIQSTYL